MIRAKNPTKLFMGHLSHPAICRSIGQIRQAVCIQKLQKIFASVMADGAECFTAICGNEHQGIGGDMSKIEKYKSKLSVARRINQDVVEALGEDSPRNDKHRILVNFLRCANEAWSPMLFSIHASHGYYGSSSGYSNTSDELGRYLARAISEQKVKLFRRAAELAGQDAECARIDAEEEARMVLEETATE